MTGNIDDKARVAVTVAVLLALAALVWAAFDVRSGNVAILKALDHEDNETIRTLAIDYVDSDGQPRHVSVTAGPDEEAAHLVARLKADLSAMQEQFPKRK